jgi:putative ABC transport system permease protein
MHIPIKTSIRSILKNKLFTLINMLGLTVGFSACLLIALYIQHEYTFDRFQPNGDRIARVIMEYSFDGSPGTRAGNFTSTKVAPVFSRTFPEVESAVRMRDATMLVRNGDALTSEPDFMFADSSFFDVFAYSFVAGNPEYALDGPRKVVVTESAAKKYFGDQIPVGKTLLLGSDKTPYEVTGVMKDYPSNSQFRFNMLASFSSLGENQEETYFDANYTTYLLLKDPDDFQSLQNKITPFMKKEMAGSGASINFYLEPFTSVHLHSPYSAFVPNTSIQYLYILGAVAALILVIVSFTYINLSTARSVERAREVGIRKVAGAARHQLFWQFICESFVMCAVAVLASLSLAMLALPYFNDLTEKQLALDGFFTPGFLMFSLAITIVVSLLAGSYPAIVLSGFQPIRVLKGLFRNSGAGKGVQQSLSVFQFAISVLLIVATFIVQKQLYFIQHKDMGYDRDQIVVLPMNESILNNLSTIKHELTSNPGVFHVSRCVSAPVHIVGGYVMRSAAMPENEQISVYANPVDEDYIQTTGLHIVAGQDLTEQDLKDVAAPDRKDRTYHFILNESAAHELGWTPEEAVGKKMFLDSSRPGFVKGVVKDFHFESLHTGIKPLVLFTEIRDHGQLLVKISGADVQATLTFIRNKWMQLVPDVPFDYRFLDEDYAKLYRSELQLGKVMNLFAGIAILLACTGLFGLSSFVAQQRIKEIGIRKILGASLLGLVSMLSGKFARLVIIAILIASPLAYVLMKKWLSGFAYRIDIPWWVFAVSSVLSIGIAVITVTFQSVKAATANPATTLRAE